jgi:hypothetical protein
MYICTYIHIYARTYVCVNVYIYIYVYIRAKTQVLTDWLNDWLTKLSRSLPEKLTDPQLVKKFPAIYRTRRFITAFTSTRHLSLSWVRSIPSRCAMYFNIVIFYAEKLLAPRSYPPYCRPLPHPQPEDAPCRGDRGPHVTRTASPHTCIS